MRATKTTSTSATAPCEPASHAHRAHGPRLLEVEQEDADGDQGRGEDPPAAEALAEEQGADGDTDRIDPQWAA
jgi:hypothetical protein